MLTIKMTRQYENAVIFILKTKPREVENFYYNTHCYYYYYL